jgi:hypothetical protein
MWNEGLDAANDDAMAVMTINHTTGIGLSFLMADMHIQTLVVQERIATALERLVAKP